MTHPVSDRGKVLEEDTILLTYLVLGKSLLSREDFAATAWAALSWGGRDGHSVDGS